MPWQIKPSLGNVVVKPLQEDEVTQSGLILINQVEKETYIAEVVHLCDPYESAASDRSLVSSGPIFKLGELVIIGKYNGRDIKLRDRPGLPHEKFIIIRETDVLGTLEHKLEVEDGGE